MEYLSAEALRLNSAKKREQPPLGVGNTIKRREKSAKKAPRQKKTPAFTPGF
jgi:hypothetical protein